jgi:geranylgeranyl pyrophosphate synthase
MPDEQAPRATPHQLVPLRDALRRGAAIVPLELRRTEQALDELARNAHEGGRRVRPIIALLSARAVGGSAPSAWRAATCVELVHTASRIIDDLLDEATARRGRQPFHLREGHRKATLAGTTLVASAFGMLAEADLSAVYLSDLVQVIHGMAAAEATEAKLRHDINLSMERRQELNRHKTGGLVGLSARLGAASAGASAKIVTACTEAGAALGEAYQALDDLLDWTANPGDLGKQVYADLSSGRITLPLQLALHADPTLASQLDELWHSRNSVLGTGALRVQILDHVQSLGAYQAAADYVHTLAKIGAQSIECLDDSAEKQALQDIATSLCACADLAKVST